MLLSTLLLGTSAAIAQRAPERIVPLTVAITQTLVELGSAPQLVAVPTGTDALAATASLPRLGVGRMPNAEAVLAVRPTLVIGDSSLAAATRTQLTRAGIRLVLVTDRETRDGAIDRITQLGTLVGAPREADMVVARLENAFVAASRLRPPTPSRVLFVYARGLGTMYAAGTSTGVGELIGLAGGINAISAFSGFKPLTAEAVVRARPDVILLTTAGLESVGGVAGLLKLPGMAATPAGRERRIVTIRDDLLLGFGPGVGQAALELARALHDMHAQADGTTHAR